MELEVDYQDFIGYYKEVHQVALFYPEVMRLKEEGLGFSGIKDKMGSKVPDSTLYFWLSETRTPLPFRHFEDIRTSFDSEAVKDLAMIVGHVLGDGGIGKDRYLRYCNTEKFLIREFQDAVKRVFRAERRCYKEPSGVMRLAYPQKFSAVLRSLFGNFAERKKEGNNKRITDQIKKMPEAWKVRLIRSLYNDDGSVPKTEQYVSLKQTHKEIILWVQEVLENMGIHSGITKDGTEWLLRVTGHFDLLKFKNQIGFSPEYRKQTELRETIKEIKFPHWKTKREIAEVLRGNTKTRKEIAQEIDEVGKGGIRYHLHGSKVSEDSGRKDIPGLVDLGVVGVNKEEREYSYYISSLQKYKQLLSNDLSFR